MLDVEAIAAERRITAWARDLAWKPFRSNAIIAFFDEDTFILVAKHSVDWAVSLGRVGRPPTRVVQRTATGSEALVAAVDLAISLGR